MIEIINDTNETIKVQVSNTGTKCASRAYILPKGARKIITKSINRVRIYSSGTL